MHGRPQEKITFEKCVRASAMLKASFIAAKDNHIKFLCGKGCINVPKITCPEIQMCKCKRTFEKPQIFHIKNNCNFI